MVSASLFQILRVQPFRGRAFTAEHEIAGRNRVALISDALWRSRYAADPGIIGKTFTVGVRRRDAPGRWRVGNHRRDAARLRVSGGPSASRSRCGCPFLPSAQEYPRGDGSSRNYNAQVIGRLSTASAAIRPTRNMAQITGQPEGPIPTMVQRPLGWRHAAARVGRRQSAQLDVPAARSRSRSCC